MSKLDLQPLKDDDGFIKVFLSPTMHRCKLDETWDIIEIQKKYSRKNAFLDGKTIIFK